MTRATLDPAIEEVLRDIAKNPKSKLFAFEPRALVAGLSEESISANASEAGFASAERHLLQVHRADVAALLIARYRERLLADDDHRCIDVHPSAEVGQLDRRTRDLVDAFRRREFTLESADNSIATLLACGNTRAEPTLARESILFAAMRLEDSPTTRTFLTLEHLSRGRHPLVIRTARQVIDSRPAAQVRHVAYEAIALALSESNPWTSVQSLLSIAADDCERDGLPPTEIAIPLLMLSVHALEEHDRASFARVVARLSDYAGSVGNAPAAHVRIIRRDRVRGWLLDEEARTICAGFLDSVSAPIRGVLDALL